MSQHQFTTTRNERVEAAVAAVRKGRGVLVVDDEDRENEGDIIFSAASITHEQMALLIRECSGIVCLCLPEDKVRQLDLPQMVATARPSPFPLRPPRASPPASPPPTA